MEDRRVIGQRAVVQWTQWVEAPLEGLPWDPADQAGNGSRRGAFQLVDHLQKLLDRVTLDLFLQITGRESKWRLPLRGGPSQFFRLGKQHSRVGVRLDFNGKTSSSWGALLGIGNLVGTGCRSGWLSHFMAIEFMATEFLSWVHWIQKGLTNGGIDLLLRIGWAGDEVFGVVLNFGQVVSLGKE